MQSNKQRCNLAWHRGMAGGNWTLPEVEPGLDRNHEE